MSLITNLEELARDKKDWEHYTYREFMTILSFVPTIITHLKAAQKLAEVTQEMRYGFGELEKDERLTCYQVQVDERDIEAVDQALTAYDQTLKE